MDDASDGADETIRDAIAADVPQHPRDSRDLSLHVRERTPVDLHNFRDGSGDVFGRDELEVGTAVIVSPPKQIEVDQEKIRELEQKLAALKTSSATTDRLRKVVTKLKGELEKVKQVASLHDQLKTEITQTKKFKTENAQLKSELEFARRSDTSIELKERLARMQDQLIEQKRLTEKTQTLGQQTQTQIQAQTQNQIQSLKTSLEQTKQENETAQLDKMKLERELHEAQQSVEKLKQEARAQAQSAEGGSNKQSFVAFFMNWSTKDHDIDLVIEDPQGKTFDFKNRKFGGHPGNFALDTRRGPGVELWQSDRLIPGRYKATYVFYNPYGNNAPASVSATIFTPKGSVELPAVEINTDTKRKSQLLFDIDKEGAVKIIRRD